MIIALYMHSTNDPFGRRLQHQRLLHHFEILSLLVSRLRYGAVVYFSRMNYLCETSQRSWCTFVVFLVLVVNIVYIAFCDAELLL